MVRRRPGKPQRANREQFTTLNNIDVQQSVLNTSGDATIMKPNFVSANVGFIFLSCIVGMLSALVVVRFKIFISSLATYAESINWFGPIVASSIACILYVILPDLGLGPPTILSGPKFSIFQQIGRAVAAASAVGLGCAFGFTGAAAEIGMTISRFVLKSFDLGLTTTDRDLLLDEQLLILVGAAAGVTANLDAPLTGIIYTIEVASQWITLPQATDSDAKHSMTSFVGNKKGLAGLLLAASVSALVTRGGLFDGGSSHFLAKAANESIALLKESNAYISSGQSVLESLAPSMWEASLFAVLGVAIGALCAAFETLRSLVANSSSRLPLYIRPICGGIACAFLAYIGHSQSFLGGAARSRMYIAEINDPASTLLKPLLLQDSQSMLTSLLQRLNFVAIKLVAMAICSGCGLIGGIMATSMFIGAAAAQACFLMLIPLISTAIDLNYARSASTLLIFTIIGAGTCLGLNAKAPLTAIVLMVELTRGSISIVPLVICLGFGTATHQLLYHT